MISNTKVESPSKSRPEVIACHNRIVAGHLDDRILLIHGVVEQKWLMAIVGLVMSVILIVLVIPGQRSEATHNMPIFYRADCQRILHLQTRLVEAAHIEVIFWRPVQKFGAEGAFIEIHQQLELLLLVNDKALCFHSLYINLIVKEIPLAIVEVVGETLIACDVKIALSFHLFQLLINIICPGGWFLSFLQKIVVFMPALQHHFGSACLQWIVALGLFGHPAISKYSLN